MPLSTALRRCSHDLNISSRLLQPSRENLNVHMQFEIFLLLFFQHSNRLFERIRGRKTSLFLHLFQLCAQLSVILS